MLVDARQRASEFVRLATRALEFHARNIGYLPGEWISSGVRTAQFTSMFMGARPRPLHHLQDASDMISAAIGATDYDLMGVPSYLSCAIGAGLALYATTVGETSGS